jgi:DNA-binding CsgD family transcriptional regulator
MPVILRLTRDLTRGSWNDIAETLDDNFFRCLIAAPDLLEDLFAAAPADWYRQHPRQDMWRALFNAARRPHDLVDANARGRFRAWVEAQPAPHPRDVLLLQDSRLRDLLAHGWYEEASSLSDRVLASLRSPRALEMADAVPSAATRCGAAKLLVGDVDDAAILFAEALHWATRTDDHPAARDAAEHLALAHALADRFAEARDALDSEPGPPTRPGALAGAFARALVALNALDLAGARSALSSIDRSPTGEALSWIELHIRARAALVDGTACEMIHRLTGALVTQAALFCPTSAPGAVLRGDLVSLYHGVDDLRAAEDVLATPGLREEDPALLLPRARHAFLLGRPDRALALLRREEPTRSSVPARLTASGAVLAAAAELAASGSLSAPALQQATSIVSHHGATWALIEATPALRALLPVAAEAPTPWVYRENAQLTRRERQVLEALAVHDTLGDVAAALHVSVNTAKSHVRALYRKLGAHSREEALRLSGSMSTSGTNAEAGGIARLA